MQDSLWGAQKSGTSSIECTCIFIDRDFNQLQDSFGLGSAELDCRHVEEDDVIVGAAGDDAIPEALQLCSHRLGVCDHVRLVGLEFLGLK